MLTYDTRSRTSLIVLAALLVLVFIMGGSARDDVQSLVILRPLSFLAFVTAAVLAYGSGLFSTHRAALFIAFSLPLLALLQLVPLPPAVWSGLPGREFIWQIGETAGITQPWRPLSIVPWRTWNSFWSLFAPLAALILALLVGRDRPHLIVLLLAGIILASGAIGILQTIGGADNRFYLYRVTNPESAVGLLANRNHHAMLLSIAFPVFAAAASVQRGARESAAPRRQLAIAMGILIIPFILVTGSRAGIVLAVVAGALAYFVYEDPARFTQARRKTARTAPRLAIIGLLGAAMVAITAIVARTSAFTRLFAASEDEDLRLTVLDPVLNLIATYFPFGSGLGTFVEVYKLIEPDRTLSPRYLNHAHNDWLEIMITAGLPGMLIAAAGIWLLVRASLPLIGRGGARAGYEQVLARLGVSIVVILAIGSVYDYPLRTPSLACLFAVAVAWIIGYRSAPEPR